MGHQLTPPQPPHDAWHATGTPLTLFLILRAFTSGCTALTGVEAITDGVPAFRPPEAKNAAKVLAILGVILVTMFLGLTFLAHQLHVIPFPVEMHGPDQHRHTVVSQIGLAVFGQTPFYYAIQAATAMILVLAANTAFVDFPRLASYLALDKFLPRQMANLGDRLVFSNGIVGLTLLSGLAVIAFGASTHHLIPLYALGVFLSFTLGQTGMLVRWFKLKPQGWQTGAAISGVGALATFVVLVIIAITKFAAGDPVSFGPITTPLGFWAIITAVGFLLVSMYHRWMGKWFVLISALAFAALWIGMRFDPVQQTPIRLGAWVVMATIPVLVWMCLRIQAHYLELADHLSMTHYEEVPDFEHTVVLVVSGVHRGIMPAVKYCRTMAKDVRAVYVEIDPAKTEETLQRWKHYVADIPLIVLESPYRSLQGPLLAYIDEVDAERDDDIVTVVIPEFVTEKWWTKLLHGQNGLLLKWALLFRRNVVVTNIRYSINPSRKDTERHPLTASGIRH